MQKERPILFSTPMIQAILEGRKTMTRRIVKQALKFDTNWRIAVIQEERNYLNPRYEMRCGTQYALPVFRCPYGTIGDKLWVRETFFDNLGDDFLGINSRWIYRADGEIDKQFEDTEGFTGWKPSIFMPHIASRITLEITNVRVERLQEITEEDAINEGVMRDEDFPSYNLDFKLCPKCGGQGVHGSLGFNLGVIEVDCHTCDTNKKRYEFLWESINGSSSWKKNPWVWVVEFKRAQ